MSSSWRSTGRRIRWRRSPRPGRRRASPSMSGSPTRAAGRRTWPCWPRRWRGRRTPPWSQLDRNWGVAGGRNRATALGTGPLRLRARQRRRVCRAGHPGPGRAGAGGRAGPGRHRLPHPGFLDRGGRPFLLGLSARSAATVGRELRRGDLRRCGPCHPAADFEAAGGYDDALFFCWEEFDFALRAINMGRRIRYRGDIAVRHKVSGERTLRLERARAGTISSGTASIWAQIRRRPPHPAAALPRLSGEGSPQWRAGPGLAAPGRRHCDWPALSGRIRNEAALYRLSQAARDYLAKNDTAHRGGLPRRVRAELLAALPGRRSALAAARRVCSQPLKCA